MTMAALIGAGGTLAATALANKMQKNRYQRELKDQQKLWQQNNAYNSPTAQMARLKAAGLNPNLVYMNGGVNATSDQISPPSFDSTPIADFNPTAQLVQNNPVLQAQIAKTKAETSTIESENKDRFSPLSKLYNLNEDEKKYYASQYGISPEQMDSYNMNRFQLLSALKKASSENENIRRLYDVIANNANQSESEAMTAKLIQLLTELEVSTEAKKRGYSLSHYDYEVNPRHFGSAWNPDMYYTLLKNHDFDAVYEMFLRELKEIHWQSSDAKHILDQVHQFSGDVGHFTGLMRGKPTIRGIERSGYDRHRGSWSQYEQYYYK